MALNFVALDFETANSFRGSPCSVGLVSVVDGKVDQTWASYIRPPQGINSFDAFNISIHGITPAHVRDAPDWQEVLKQILARVDGRPLVAHNAAFDMGVLRDACEATRIAWPELSYACSLVVSRQTWKGLESYSLPWVAAKIGLPVERHHEAEADAYAAARFMLAAAKESNAADIEELLVGLRINMGKLVESSWSGCNFRGSQKRPLPGVNAEADPDNPLFGMTVCITGDLRSIGYTRPQAWQAIADRGGRPVKEPTKVTDILVLADQDPARFRPGMDKSTKHQKAEKLRLSGCQIELITGLDFIELLASGG